RGLELCPGQDIVEKKADVRNATRNRGFGSRGTLFRGFTISMCELGCDEFGVIQSRDDVAVAGQAIRQERVASATAAAARMREQDDRANIPRGRWTPDVAREGAVAGGVERLHAPLVHRESARGERLVCQAVNDTSCWASPCIRALARSRVDFPACSSRAPLALALGACVS